ncbi:Gfo/Idh/MocA family oxidoreductase [Sphingomonas hankookensis]
MHAALSIRAAQAGKHVPCEKPLAFPVAGCEAIHRSARKGRTIRPDGRT